MRSKLTKIILSITLSVSLSGVFPAQAFLLPGSISNSASESNGSGSDLGKFLAASGNVGGNRDQMGTSERSEEKVPRNEVIVTPSHPRVGDVVYAQALPQNFRNASTKLYYSWYIYNSDPKAGSVVVKNKEKTFISSNTLEGALIRGAMAQARGSYIPGQTPKAKDLGKANEDSAKDRDGYNAHYGGDDGEGAIEKKVDDILGNDYDFTYSDFTSSCKKNCKVEYSNAENENKWKYDKCAEPTCGDWIDKCCGGSKNDFSDCVDNVWDDIDKSCFNKVCDKKSGDRKEDCYRTLSLDDYTGCDSDFFDQEMKCVDDRNLYCLNKGSCGSKPSQDCIECEKVYHNSQWEALKQRDYCDKKCAVKENNFLGSNSIEPVGSRCFRYNFGGRDSGDHLAGIFQPITCTHFFPGAKNPDKELNWDNSIPLTTGDGSFGEEEETFWGTDPSNADTDGDGFPDEADIAGLGQQTVQFKYQSGDKIGVVIEGTSLLPTNEKTPYYKTMWAFTDVCNSEVIRNAGKSSPEFNDFCRCDDKENDKCKDSKDFGFGYLKLNDIWQSVDGSQDNRLDAFINFLPLRPTVKDSLILEAVVSGNELGEELLSYEWTLKHGSDVLRSENDPKNGRIVWKKQGAEVAYTQLSNQLADFKNQGGIGWKKLDLQPLLEGDYSAMVKVVETNNNKQKIGEATVNFNVSENLKIRFFRAAFNNGTWEKKDELVNGEALSGDNVIAEYDGPFYDDFVWSIDKKKLEGNSPRISLLVNKAANSSYDMKLVASNRNHTDIVEDNTALKIMNPYVSVMMRGEKIDGSNGAALGQEQAGVKNLSYQVPLGVDLEFVASRGPAGSSFSVRDDLHYFWSFDEGNSQKGKDSFKITLDGKKFLPKTPHNLGVKIYDSNKKLLAEGKVALIPVLDKNSQTAENSRGSIGGMAFAYLNVSEKLRFLIQTLLWVFFIYFLLVSVAWLTPIRNKKEIKTSI